MMRPNFDDLVRPVGGDGASAVGRIPDVRSEAETDSVVQEMMGAWSIERQRAVEAELVLKKTLRYLRRKLRSDRLLSNSDRHEARELIRAIRFRLQQQH